ncbi:hypothetical protein PPYR_11729 [Photinus pyralis]|uniref:RNA-directed DNA polymerase n=2 Tax=Photinus pyralis TaxID=7054 RepID=A0A5N4AC36_PHOPY|nr:hypothetical protein PPYR_11729 [Photinus pyralis]
MAAISPEQLAQITAAVAAAFLQIDQTRATPLTTPSVNPNIPPFEQYDAKKEDFKLYRERFENYLRMKEVFDNKTKSACLLLGSIGATHYQTINALVAPQKPSELSYDELITHLEKHLSPERNMLVAQHYFLSTYQSGKQSISEYVTELKKNLGACNFLAKCQCTQEVSTAEQFLRAQFIRGLKDTWITEQLLQSNLTEFNEIVKKAIALEAARTDSQNLAKTSTPSTNTSINSVIPSREGQFTRRQSQNSQHNRKPDHNRHRSSSRNYRQQSHQNRNSSQGRVNYRELGIDNMCLFCGRDNHTSKDCRVQQTNLKCTGCGKQGHVANVCISTLIKSKRDSSAHNTTYNIDNFSVNRIEDVYSSEGDDTRKYYTFINVEGQAIQFDSGAGFTLLPKDLFDKLNCKQKLKPSNLTFRTYTRQTFQPHGKVQVMVQYHNNQNPTLEDLYVVPEGYDPLVGREWIRHLNIQLQEIDKQTSKKLTQIHSDYINSIESVREQFPNIFEQKVGCVPNVVIKLALRDNVKPVYTRERSVAYALRDKVSHELEMLESAGIISKCDVSDWGSPLVVVQKPQGGVRLCVDYKVAVNDSLVNVNYPIKRVDEVLNSLRDSSYFCRLDLYKAYLHLRVDKDSSVIQTMSTHQGTYHVNRLSFGIKTAPAEFNRVIDQILRDCPKTTSYFDDIIVHGNSYKECYSNLIKCLTKLQENDLHLNEAKCSFFQNEIEYLGYIIRKNTIAKSPDKVKAILNMPNPKNVADVRRFLGMITYYARLLPNLSSMTAPLRKLLQHDNQFLWNQECNQAFNNLKMEIASDRVVVPYDPEQPVLLTTDASPYGIAAVLSHSTANDERPIAFASRSLTRAEQNYSQLDREALAIVYGVSHFQQYLIGKSFTLSTDNQPLVRIFNSKSKASKTTSSRLIRYASFLSTFDYKVQFKKGIDNTNADCLSRAPLHDDKGKIETAFDEELDQVNHEQVFNISTDQIGYERIKYETGRDSELCKIIEQMKTQRIESEFLLNDGVLYRSHRIVIPKTMQADILNDLHSTHLGSTKMKQLARRYCYWQNIDKEIENIVRACEECKKRLHSPPKAEVHRWELPQENWDRVHIDYAGPIDHVYILLCIDAKSRWAEMEVLREHPNSENTMELLNRIFSRNGYPKEMVSDNATIFTSNEFRTYCKNNAIFQKFIAPGHPATNGLAERNVQTLKNKLKSMSTESIPLETKIMKILFRYRATPLLNGKTPAEQYLNRKFRIRLDSMFLHIPTPNQDLQKRRARSHQAGEDIVAEFYIQNKRTWKPGTVVKCLGKLHYLVRLENDRIVKRHVNQLRRNAPKQVTFNLPEEPQIQKPLEYEEEYQPAILPRSLDRQEMEQILIPEADRPEPPRRSNRNHRPPPYLSDYQMNYIAGETVVNIKRSPLEKKTSVPTDASS